MSDANAPDVTGSSVVALPKAFFEAERNKFYSNWIDAFPREFVQNSVDAKATRLDITIEAGQGKGSFGQPAAIDAVTRIRFTDDGTGMTKDVLDKVFFALGESTKRGDDGAVGGFGRARIMQAFSQVRYSILTRDRFVEGDGPNYVNLPAHEAKNRLGAWAHRLRGLADEKLAAGDHDGSKSILAAANQHDADAAALPAEPGSQFRGCTFEVDLDPSQGRSRDSRPTPERMERAFREYFATSDVRCEVWINGSRLEQPKRRLDTRKRIAATMEAHEVPESFAKSGVEILDRADGRKDVVFARLLSVPEKHMLDGERGYMNVRVKGASMYRKSSNSDNHALILEIDPKVAREVLTSNRDSMRSPYSDAVDEFTRMMATDANKAMRENDEIFEVLPGGLGAKMRPRRRKPEVETPDAGRVPEQPPEPAFEAPEAPTPRLQALEEKARTSRRHVGHSTWRWDDVVKEGIEGVPFATIQEHLEAIAKSESVSSTVLAGYHNQSRAEAFRQTLQRQGENTALDYASGDMLGFLLDNIRFRAAAAEEKAAEVYRDKLGALHDVPIMKKDMLPPEDRYDEAERKRRRLALSRAAQRCDPRRWDHPSGKGRAPHMLLAAWQVTVDMVLDLLHEVKPELEPFPYSVGWSFSHQRWDSFPNRKGYGWMNDYAKFVRTDPNSTECHFLLNPLDDEDFGMRYDIRKSEDLSLLWARAAHEVAHVGNSGHTEGFAMDLTSLMELSTPAIRKEHEKRVRDAGKAVSQLFGGGQTKVQPLDDEPGPRPAERLLAGLSSGEPRPMGSGRVYDVDAAHRNDAEMLAEARPVPVGLHA